MPGRCRTLKQPEYDPRNSPQFSQTKPTLVYLLFTLHNHCIMTHASHPTESTVWDPGANIGSATQQVLSMRTKLMMRMSTRELRGTKSKLGHYSEVTCGPSRWASLYQQLSALCVAEEASENISK